MNKTKIEWCDSTWNPVSGCYHGCTYCYARRIAERFRGSNAYPNGFDPTFREDRLSWPANKKGRTVFVCSMADLFGEWVPEGWIERVMEVCQYNPQHRYLFLTKNPARYIELSEKGLLPEADNMWYGSSATTANDPVFWSDKHNTFISMEPILENFGNPGEDSLIFKTDWVIIGAETGNRKDKVIPKKEWITEAVEYFKENHIPVFMKDSMKPIWGEDILTEFPW